MTHRRSARANTPRDDAGVNGNTVPTTEPKTPSPGANRAYSDAELITPSHGHGLIRPWRPGESGNPNGRPRLVQEMRARFIEMARRCTFNDLEDLLKDGEPAVRIQAHRLILEYAYGKPPSIPIALFITDPAKEVQIVARRDDAQLVHAREEAEAEWKAAQRREIEQQKAELMAQVAAEEAERAEQIRQHQRAAQEVAKQKPVADASPLPASAASFPPPPTLPPGSGADAPASETTGRFVSVEEFRRLVEQRQGRSHMMGPRRFGPGV